MSIKKTMVYASLACKCPRCREGNMFVDPYPYHFKKMTEMESHCSHCGLDFIRETSFYFGAMYVSYALTIAYGVGCFLLFYLLLGISLFQYLLVNALLLLALIPYTFRLARTIWITIMIRYSPNETGS